MDARLVRRGVAGLGTLAIFAVAARGAADPPSIAQRQVGRQTDGSVVVTTNQLLRPSGRQLEFPGRPLAVALHPNGQSAVVLDGTYKGLLVVEPETGAIKQEVDVPGNSPSFAGLIFSRDGHTLYASLATGVVQVAAVADDGTLTLDGQITGFPKSTALFPGREDGNPYPGGLALSEDGSRLYVALNRNNSLAVVDTAARAILKEIPVGNAPHDVVVAGGRAYVSNQGGRPAEPGDRTLNSSGTAIVANGRGAYASTGTVSVVDLGREAQVKTIEVGLQPTALLVHDRRLYVANTGNDTVSVIALGSDSVVHTLAVTPFPQAPLGSSPNALAFVDDEHLAVSLGRNNAVALYRVQSRPFPAAKFEGLLPTGWYPSSIAVDETRRELIVANGKGVGSLGPLATVGPDPTTNKTGHYVHSNRGSVSFLPFPSARDLALGTRNVFENNGWNHLGKDDGGECGRVKPLPIPEKTGDPSLFKHVVYIVKENRTYDQLFGDVPQGNGDPTLVQFGAEVTPNHRALAQGFVLLDNMYDSGSLSADGHQWATQAFANDYIEKSFGAFTRSYPFNDGDVLTHARTGFLWENALRQHRSVRVYGEFINGLAADGIEMGPWNTTFLGHGVTDAGTWTDFYRDALRLAVHDDDNLHVGLVAHSDIPSLEPILCRPYPPYHQIIPDQYRVEVFLREFNEFVKRGEMPELTIMALTSDHTNGTAAAYPTPRAMIADNDLAVGRVVEAISHSPFWKDTVIFVTEDDAQNGVDHVDGHRMPALVVSPYTKRGSVDSHYYSQINVVRTIEQIFGLYPMNQMDAAVPATSMRTVFTEKGDFTPYQVRPNIIPLDEMNPSPTALAGAAKAWAIASAKLDFSEPDQADSVLLNRAIWYATKGFDKPYPGDARVLLPDEVHAYLEKAASASTATSNRLPM